MSNKKDNVYIHVLEINYCSNLKLILGLNSPRMLSDFDPLESWVYCVIWRKNTTPGWPPQGLHVAVSSSSSSVGFRDIMLHSPASLSYRGGGGMDWLPDPFSCCSGRTTMSVALKETVIERSCHHHRTSCWKGRCLLQSSHFTTQSPATSRSSHYNTLYDNYLHSSTINPLWYARTSINRGRSHGFT